MIKNLLNIYNRRLKNQIQAVQKYVESQALSFYNTQNKIGAVAELHSDSTVSFMKNQSERGEHYYNIGKRKISEL